MATFYQYFVVLLISLFQVVFVYIKGYFLSIEFTLYPYLTQKGFLPYKNIVDQHFPSLFFGTFSLPLLSSSSHIPLLILFLGILVGSNLLLFRYLKKTKTIYSLAWVALYSLLMCYFAGNVLWIEIVINILILISLNLSSSNGRHLKLISGLVISQAIIIRPTLAPAIFLLFFWLKEISLEGLLGAALGTIFSLYYLTHNHLTTDFFNLVIDFNSRVYSKVTHPLPTLKQILPVIFLLLLFLAGLIRQHKTLVFFIILLSLLSAYPRFGFEHLQPFVLVWIILGAINQVLDKKHLLVCSLIFIFLSLYSLYKNQYGNYFYSPEVLELANKVSRIPSTEIYLFGTSDLIYPLSNKVPPQKTYIPSLSWYLNYYPIQKKLYESLESSSAPVIVDTQFSVDGIPLIESAQNVYLYIKMNYKLVSTDGRYEFYYKKI